MKELGFRKINKGKLKLAVDVQLDSGLQHWGLMGFEDGGRLWISPPSLPVLIDGQHVKNESTGKPAYKRIIGFKDAKTRERISQAIIDLVLHAHPDPFGSAP